MTRKRRKIEPISPTEITPIKLREFTTSEKRKFGHTKPDWILRSWNYRTYKGDSGFGKGWTNEDGSISLKINDRDDLKVLFEIADRHFTLKLIPSKKNTILKRDE
jgi:hypothetical protein